MKQKLKNLNEKLNSLIDYVGIDKIIHVSISANIVFILHGFVGIFFACLISSLIGLIRELYGNKDMGDMLANFIGVSLAWLVIVIG